MPRDWGFEIADETPALLGLNPSKLASALGSNIGRAMLRITVVAILVIPFVLLLVLGSMMDMAPLIVIATPILLPVVTGLGMDPVHFGVVMVCCCVIGFQTPPLGENIFIASGVSNASVEQISLQALPFAGVATIAVFIIAYVPEISLWLPRVLGY